MKQKNLLVFLGFSFILNASENIGIEILSNEYTYNISKADVATLSTEIQTKILEFLPRRQLMQVAKRKWTIPGMRKLILDDTKEEALKQAQLDLIEGICDGIIKEIFLRQFEDQETQTVIQDHYGVFYHQLYQKHFPQYYPKILKIVPTTNKYYSVITKNFDQIPDTNIKTIIFNEFPHKRYNYFFSNSEENPNIGSLIEHAKQNEVCGIVLLQWMMEKDCLDKFQQCLVDNPNIIFWGHGSDNPLVFALLNNDTVLAELLIRNGTDINVKNEHGETPLFFAIRKKHTALVELLIECGVDTNVKNTRGDTPLIVAIRNNHIKLVELLIKKGAEVNIKNELGNTPLMFVVMNGDNTELAKKLIERGANINVKNTRGDTPLLVAIRKRREELRKLFTQYGANNAGFFTF